MNKLILLCLVSVISIKTYGQLSVTKESGGSVITKLGMGVKVNDGSTLSREFFTVNAKDCPVQIQSAGIRINYSTRFSCVPVGKIVLAEPITAYEIHHVLYNVFGEHIKTLRNTVVTDISSGMEFNQFASWYASENEVSEYLICVSYVATVRTATGVIWRYNFKDIQMELNKLKLKFEEGDLPNEVKNNGE